MTLEATLPLYQLVTEALLRGLARSSTPTHRSEPVLWVCDEGHLLTPPNLAQHLNTLRDYGVTTLLVLQSRAQLRACYGNDGAEAIEAACATQIYYRPADTETPKYISARAGAMPFPQESTSQHDRKQTTNVNLITRPLIRPEEVMELKDEQVIVFPQGRPPVAARRLWPTDTKAGRAAFLAHRKGGRTHLTPRYKPPALAPLILPTNPKQLELRLPDPGSKVSAIAETQTDTTLAVLSRAVGRIAQARERKNGDLDNLRLL